ncbi:TetR/AcrR family transcriptional regulator [Siccirubricoccus sp. KC 17139]|uniref:TetR/AcrR family transcriptional regulator n=1 Tax=Siccirubricoccus soli TaxID=2899147 RepID=A0ABT1D114_9PROT|nr:TetR/AcrR family transcriptional regulator [Siccirubricoccus soli]MCO6415564.1 TetR/AcrR family transcriptional regulator [Siccirubricoccus soli]MCP2681696.1 TetR/AcrR family transcriptional regulator [Siccirubricoccus soli]
MAPHAATARDKLLDAAIHVVRSQGYAASSVDEICREAGVTKGAFFHHFPSKEALAIAAAGRFAAAADTLCAAAPYRALPDPAARVLGYVALRRDWLRGELAEITCFAGTVVQEAYATSPALRAACEAAICGHAATLDADIEAAMQARGLAGRFSPAGLSRHIQAVIQGAFILAKATGEVAMAEESLDHLRRYLELLFTTKKRDVPE